MEIIFIGFAIIGGALVSLVYRPDAALALKIARLYILLVLLLSACAWVFYFAGIKNQFTSSLLGSIVTWGKYPARMLLGYLVMTVFLGARSMDETYPIEKLIRLTLTGVSLATGFTFLIATEGKAANMPDMIAFFKQSGYSLWFLYFIMAMETLGAIGVLLHFKLKTGPLATAGLMLIMIGAMYTHRHNKDPLSDSFAAMSQFITLGIMLILFYFERGLTHKPSVETQSAASEAVGY
jgi:hypothetical protein